ncbi:MAG: PD-(D/E)XK nuclease family protein [Candidatus Promineifilaceae bacterium]
MQNLTLSRGKIISFLNCQRRFQLRHVTALPWPAAPMPQEKAEALLKGTMFHQMAERHFLGMPDAIPVDIDENVKRWWEIFQRRGPHLPEGKRFPEASMTIVAGGMRLFGRFDLLITNDTSAHIYDWKTERSPRSAWRLREDWQTRLYLALVVEGADALGHSYHPDDVSMTYWFAEAPEQSVVIRYNSDWHRQNWAEIKATIGRIERRLAASEAIWPLTDDLELCASCGYRTYCGRDAVVAVEPSESELEWAFEESAEMLEIEPEYTARF